MSAGFWDRAFGGMEGLGDTRLPVNGVEYQIVGVVPRGVELPTDVDLWVSAAYRPFTGYARNNINWLAVARLADRITIEQAATELSSIAEGIRESDPEGLYSYGVGVEPLQDVIVGEMRGNLMLLQGSVFLVLFVACINLMGLQFAKMRERQEELAVRLSLGVGKQRLIQQLVTEQMVMAVLGGLLGIVLAAQGTDFVMDRLGSALPRAQEVAFDGRIVLFGFGVSLLAGLLAGLAPAWRASRGDPGRVLAGTRTVRGGKRLPGGVLISAEVALTVVLLTASGLLVRSLGVLVNRDLGFDTEGLVTLDVTLLNPEYLEGNDRVVTYWTSLLERLNATPGVRVAGAGNYIPTGGDGTSFIVLPRTGRTPEGAGYRVVSDKYFEALGTPLLEGRVFGVEDQAGSERVVVINEAMAEAFWPGECPLGQWVKAEGMEGYGDEAPWLTVIGVVGTMRHRGFERDPRPEMFTLFRQVPPMMRIATAVVRAEPGSVRAVMESALGRAKALDPSVAVQPGLLTDRVRGLMAERRLITNILITFSLISLVLASLGIYGVLAFEVATRKREMAIRTALGARRVGLVGLVVRSGMAVVAIGVAAGGAAALALGGLLDALLVEVSATDPTTVGGVVATIFIVSVAAATAPAIRAAVMNPLDGLREG